MSTPAVLVVGAGPTGLTLTHELARRGVSVRLVDAADGPAVTSRALATHARTLEVFDQMGVAERLLPRGCRVEHFTLHQRGRELIRFDTNYDRLPTRFPFTLMVDQAVTEQVLRERVAELGVEVEWGVELTGLTRREDRVDVRLRAGGVESELSVPWLVGTDGGHSTVRKELGLKLHGDQSQTWLIADAEVECSLPQNSIHWLDTGAGTVMLVPFPEPGKWRLLDTADIGGDADRVVDRFTGKISRAIGERVVIRPPSWVSVFTIQQRMIEAMGRGRCLLAGDAAHVHSPASGQGMNTGIQDAYNLGWKLAAVVTGEAGPELLRSYDDERMPVGRKLLGSTRTATALVALRSAAMSTLMPVGLAALRRLTPAKRRLEHKIMSGMSGLSLSYPDSVLSGPDGCTRAGWAPSDCADPAALASLLRTPGWTLWTVPGDSADWPAAVAAIEGAVPGPLSPISLGSGGEVPDPDGALAARLGLGPGSWLVVRPDGYRWASGTGPEALRAAAARWPFPAADAIVTESG
ncbi:FAD-dependent monooxygenase [Amycolatopsis sp. cg13]|uniref:FAD-dependent monooxygenase n=1 Tax=Amycolatopsis sp. cg13 TaxID=3238807 RepID=UPI003523FE47